MSSEGSAISEGMRAGAGVLVLVTLIVTSAIVRFGYRLWAAEEGKEQASAVTHD